MFDIGIKVRILDPFKEFFPGVYEIIGQNPDTGSWVIEGNVDFVEDYLEIV